jgi:hypothetical protein
MSTVTSVALNTGMLALALGITGKEIGTLAKVSNKVAVSTARSFVNDAAAVAKAPGLASTIKTALSNISKTPISSDGLSALFTKGPAAAAQIGEDAALTVGKSLGTAANVIGPVVQTAVDLAINKDFHPQNIASDIVGYSIQGAWMAADPLLAGVMMIIQSVDGIVAQFWNPFNTMFQSDLDAMKQNYINAYVYNFMVKMSLTWPLEVKPQLPYVNAEGNVVPESESTQFYQLFSQYLHDNGLVMPADVGNIQNLQLLQSENNRSMNKAWYDVSNATFAEIDTGLSNILITEDDQLMSLLQMIVQKKKGVLLNLPNSAKNTLAEFNEAVNNKVGLDRGRLGALVVVTILVIFSCLSSSSVAIL